MQSPFSKCSTALLWSFTLLLTASCTPREYPLEGTEQMPAGIDIHRFDPIATYPAMAAIAGKGYQLRSLEASFVREDGTQDLAATYIPDRNKDDSVKYTFNGATREQAPTPIGVERRKPLIAEVYITVAEPRMVLVPASGVGIANTKKKHLGMSVGRNDVEEKPADPAPPPACSFAKLWTIAKTRGAPVGAVAKINYDSKGYEFKIEGTPVDLRFDSACTLVLKP